MALLPMAASADDSGKCGKNATYHYDESTHTLTIEGSGSVLNYGQDDLISFTASAEDYTHATRGVATSSGAFAFSDFQTWGYNADDGGIYMGNSATAGRTVTYCGSVWGYTPQQFWPLNHLNFVAIAPSAPNGVIGNAVAQDAMSKVITLTSGVTLSTNVENQEDIMFAEASAIGRNSFDGNVPFTFKHALSQIVFKGKLPANGSVTKATVAEITIGGIGNTATLSVTSAGVINGGNAQITATNPSVFTLDAADLDEETFEAGVGGVVAGTAFDLTVSNSSVFTDGNAWFMLPQTTTAWVPASNAELEAGALNAAPVTGSYLKIRAQLEKDGVVILKDDQPIYIPLAANWDRSKKYTYTIEFGGKSTNTPLTYTVTSEDWNDIVISFSRQSGMDDPIVIIIVPDEGSYAEIIPWWNYRDEIESVIIKNDISGIGAYSFYSCSNLKNVTIPATLTEIGASAFASCTSLTDFYCQNSNPPVTGEDVFKDTPINNAYLHVPTASIGTYRTTEPWKGFKEIISLENTKHKLSYKVDGTLYKSYDIIVGMSIIPVAEPTKDDYTFSGWSEIPTYMPNEDVTVTGTFSPIATEATINVSSVGQGTFSFELPLDFSHVGGVKAYIASGFNPDNGSVLMMRVYEVPAKTGLFVKTIDGGAGSFTIPVKNTSFYYLNLLKPALTAIDALPTTEGNNTNYVLANGPDGLLFYKSGGAKLAANRAYLQVPTYLLGSYSQARSISYTLDDEDNNTTGIDKVNDGVSDSGMTFNLHGQRVSTPRKGVYVRNGKKILVK